jgi:hypothetical protein
LGERGQVEERGSRLFRSGWPRPEEESQVPQDGPRSAGLAREQAEKETLLEALVYEDDF